MYFLSTFKYLLWQEEEPKVVPCALLACQGPALELPRSASETIVSDAVARGRWGQHSKMFSLCTASVLRASSRAPALRVPKKIISDAVPKTTFLLQLLEEGVVTFQNVQLVHC